MRFVEETGKTADEAIEKALKTLGAAKEEVKIEVMEEENKGLFGFGASKLVKVKVSLFKNSGIGELSKEILSRILELMEIKAEVIIKETPEIVNLEIKTDDAAILIGKRGQTLNALQEIVTLISNQKSGGELKKRIVVDTEDYRIRRADVLIGLARKTAQEVIKTKQKIELEPMPSQERYVIHSTLQNHPQVKTESVGEGIERRVVISPK
ncbi:MAG: RNA-binding cell elongation regulator Jag/EloR [bacterium]